MSQGTANATSLAYALKTRYTSKQIENLTLAECPFMAKVAKDTDFSGEGTVIPMIHGNPQGISGNIVTAKANKTTSVGKKLILSAGDLTAATSFTDKVMAQSRNNPGAFLRARAVEVDGLYTSFADTLNYHFWGNGGGAIGQIAAGGISGNTFTLADISDVVNFEEGMSLVFSTGDGSDVAHVVKAGATYVTAVNRATGVVTVNDFGDITGEAALDYVFREGTFVGNTGTFVTHGIESFITPTDVPGTIYSMVRTSDPQRLAGCRMRDADVSGLSIENRLKKLGARMTGMYKGKGPTDVFLNPEDWQDLEIEMNSRGIRALEDESTRFGFMTLSATIGGKSVKIWSDRFCPRGTAFALRLENWTCHSMEALIKTMNGDGLTILRGENANDYEYRLVSYPALSCNAPGYSGRVSLTV